MYVAVKVCSRENCVFLDFEMHPLITKKGSIAATESTDFGPALSNCVTLYKSLPQLTGL